MSSKLDLQHRAGSSQPVARRFTWRLFHQNRQFASKGSFNGCYRKQTLLLAALTVPQTLPPDADLFVLMYIRKEAVL